MSMVSKIYRATSFRERVFFFSALALFCAALVTWVLFSHDRFTTAVPAPGGTYTEGVVGQPSFVNPLFVGSNDVDRDLVEILFKDVISLSETYRVHPDGKTWTLRLREGGMWHDGTPLTSDDVIFTIATIQNPDARSSLFSAWQGIRAERVSEREVTLILPAAYAFFEDQLRDLRPIPKHLFEGIPSANFRLSQYVLEPVGNGPFRFVSFDTKKNGFITRYTLRANEQYGGAQPYLDEFVFRFYSDEGALIDDFNSGALDGVGGLYPDTIDRLVRRHQLFSLSMPRYYAVFFNQFTHPALKDPDVRAAMKLAINKDDIIAQVFRGAATSVRGPLLPTMAGYKESLYPADVFSLEEASSTLGARGWQAGADGVRTHTTIKETLSLELIIPQGNAFLAKTAELLRDSWGKVGIALTIRSLPSSEMNDAIRTRNYQMLLFGNVFGRSTDLYSFWHSSERFYPGLNLSLYENRTVDSLIESVRKTIEQEKRARDWDTLQTTIIRDAPAIFLYSPHYFYVTSPRLQGFEESVAPLASDRFDRVEHWYVHTKRVLK